MNYIFVLAPTRRVFENVCSIDWNERPNDKKFVVITQLTQHSAGRRWKDGDEIRIVAPELVKQEMAHFFWYVMASLGAPMEELDKIPFYGVENMSLSDVPTLHQRYNTVEEMEVAGQDQLVNSVLVPVKVNFGTDEDLEALGFKLGKPLIDDPIFRPATFPTGWTRRPGETVYWSEILDAEGNVRIKVFYKAAFYDRRAGMNLQLESET